MQARPTALFSLFLLTFAACSSVDDERRQMRGTIDSAGALASEITNWRNSLNPDIPATVVKSIKGFQGRAHDLRSSLDGLSSKATAGTDLTALKQALQTMVDFDTSKIDGSSGSARASMLDQFQGLATNLQTAVTRVRQH